jgi:hypothetical protein
MLFITCGSAINIFNSFKDLTLNSLGLLTKFLRRPITKEYSDAKTCSIVESGDIVADTPPQVDGGGSNATTFRNGWCWEGDENVRSPKKMLRINN